jgi:hypothetical protein
MNAFLALSIVLAAPPQVSAGFQTNITAPIPSMDDELPILEFESATPAAEIATADMQKRVDPDPVLMLDDLERVSLENNFSEPGLFDSNSQETAYYPSYPSLETTEVFGDGNCSTPVCSECYSSKWRKGCGHCRKFLGIFKYRCLDSTCDMPPHYPYEPCCHGYYSYRPYNYQHVLAHQANPIGSKSSAPYTTILFGPIYDQLLTEKEKKMKGAKFGMQKLPRTSKELPDLEEILKSKS